jgi:AcrR family transcriptional regulator
MSRPSLAETRRPELLDAYARALLKHGPEGATLDRIGEEAGVTRALVRHYLGNRREVDRALVVHLRDRYVDWMLGLGAGLPPVERLAAILTAIFEEEAAESPARLVDALLGASGEDPVLLGRLREMYLEFEHLLDAELAAAYPDAEPPARRRVAYGILCLAGMNRSLVELGFPADRSTVALACAKQLIDTLR